MWSRVPAGRADGDPGKVEHTSPCVLDARSRAASVRTALDELFNIPVPQFLHLEEEKENHIELV